ncbi:MAG: hypothetical protein MJZ00_01630 [Paludibacteraceae bacterium]|nr:hypothetical protein [Paludibacteraceae bacterium]
MKKILLLLLLTAVSLFDLNAQTKPAAGDGSEERPFMISTADELLWFSGYVAGDYTESPKREACATLIADINMATLKSEWIPIGDDFDLYSGIFDGGNHRIDSLRLVSKENVGLFKSLRYAVVKNVSVYGDSLKCTTRLGYAGGICAEASNSVINNCYSNIKIIGPSAGGICGYATGSVITECTNNGIVSGSINAGGICGEIKSTDITQCVNNGGIYVGSTSGGGVVGQASKNSTMLYSINKGFVLPLGTGGTFGGFCGILEDSKIDVSYNTGYVPYVEKLSGAFVGLYKGSAVTTKRCVTYCIPEQRTTRIIAGTGDSPRTEFVRYTQLTPFYNGAACVALNDGLDTLVWAQNLDDDFVLPYLAAGLDDYFVKVDSVFLECPDASLPYRATYENFKFGDSLSIDTVIMNPDHIDENGDNKCDVCLHYLPSYMKQYENSPFEIGSAEDLVLFKDIVENGNPSIDAVLTADIDMSSVCSEENGPWITILYGKDYEGTFDGNGHVISNFYSCFATRGIEGPLFYSISDTIKNLTMSKGKSVVNYGAPLVYHNKGVIVNCVSDSMVTTGNRSSGLVVDNEGVIERCMVKDMSPGYYCSGFADENNGIIRNCCFIGDTVIASGFTGITNYNASTIDNCIVYSYLNGNQNFAISAYNLENVNNSYTLPTSTDNTCDTLIFTSAEDFASGAICVKLNEGQEQTVWYQTLGVDPYPVLDPTHGIVIYDETLGYCNETDDNTDSDDNEDEKPSFSVAVNGREIRVLGVESFLIFDMAGKDVTSKNGELNNGIYIICVNGAALKVVVKG